MGRLFRQLHFATNLGVKFFVPVALFCMLFIVSIIGVNNRILSREITEQYKERARGVALLFDHELGEAESFLSNPQALDQHIKELLIRYPEVYQVNIYRRVDGVYRVIASSDAARVGSEADSPDIEPLRTGRVHIEEAVEDGRRILEAVFPLRRDGQIVATLGAYSSLLERDRRLAAINRRVAMLALLAVIIVLSIIYVVVGMAVVAPLRGLLTNIERVAAGDLDREGIIAGESPTPAARDEMTRFASAFATMVRMLRQDRDQLRDLAIRDSLTGLHNRRFLEEIMERELAQAVRYQQSFAIAVIDVNGLREVNNRMGHQAGDALLRRTAEFLRRNVRASDEVTRWGGDEFVILMPHTNAAQASQVQRRLGAGLADHNSRASEGERLEFSIGVSSWTPGRDIEAVMREADTRMYDDKHGRPSDHPD